MFAVILLGVGAGAGHFLDTVFADSDLHFIIFGTGYSCNMGITTVLDAPVIAGLEILPATHQNERCKFILPLKIELFHIGQFNKSRNKQITVLLTTCHFRQKGVVRERLIGHTNHIIQP